MANGKTESATATAVAFPKTKYCVAPDDSDFGSVAVYSDRMGRWGVMNPGLVNPDALGGHWATDAEVSDWADAQAPADPAPAPTPSP